MLTSGDVFGEAPLLLCTTARARHTGTQAHRHTGTQAHRHTDTQAHRHTDTQAHRHTDTHRHRQTNLLSILFSHSLVRGRGGGCTVQRVCALARKAQEGTASIPSPHVPCGGKRTCPSCRRRGRKRNARGRTCQHFDCIIAHHGRQQQQKPVVDVQAYQGVNSPAINLAKHIHAHATERSHQLHPRWPRGFISSTEWRDKLQCTATLCPGSSSSSSSSNSNSSKRGDGGRLLLPHGTHFTTDWCLLHQSA